MLRLLRAYQYHFLLLALFFLSSQANPSPSSSSTKQLCSEEEAAALIQFKSSFSIDSAEYCGGIKSYPKTESWKEGTDCCSWDGVTCDEIKGQVIGLDLSCSCLKGRISSNSTLFHLRHLRELNLALNDFNYSKMPSKFGGFESLVELNLSSTHFAGQVPSQLSYLSKLVSLDLSGNGNYDDDDLVLDNDTLERLVRNLTEMRQLHLDELNMSCVNPSALMNLSSSLSSLRLSFCDLRGNFPENIFLLPNLKYLDLGWNQNLNLKFPELINRSSPLQLLDLSKLSLSKDDSISSLQSLKDLNLIGTSFSGGRGFPASIMNLSSLEHLDANDAYFSGAFGGGLLPDSIGNLVSLKYLDLSNCNMSGPLPISLGNLSQLTKLSLSNNKFRGQIPSTLTNLTQLEELSLDHNQLEGSIPDDKVTAFPNLTSLDLSHNLLNGTFPSWLFTASFLWSLNLSSNQFSGVEDDMFSKLQSLSLLDLSYNPHLYFISNSTSADYTLPNNLLDLDLACCNITEFPHFLKGSTSLFSLDLSYNRIHGKIPEWMWNVGKDSLTYLDLSHNSLTQVEQLPWKGIEGLDLSSNLIHGHLPIPPPGTMLFRISNNSLSGEISPLICINGSYIEIVDLSHNNLSGGISSLVCNESFLRSLDLSHNSLSGEISSLICNATSLEVLDLSHNNLSGVVPHCLANFSNGLSELNIMMNTHGLSTLNLGMNNLYGIIPPAFAKNCQLTYLNLNGNQFEGPLPRSIRNCRKLQVLDVGNNNINGTFPHWLESLPNLQALVLKSNQFHGSIIGTRSSHSFSKIQIFDLSSNYFTGPLPVRYMNNFKAMMNLTKEASAASYMGVWREYGGYFYSYSIEIVMKGQEMELLSIFTMLTTIDLSNNKFQGEIPLVIGELNSLKGLNLSHNNLSGRIPSSMGDLVSLEWLDLSSNKLVGTIPERLVDVTSLSFLNLSENHLHGQIPQGKQFNTFGNDSYQGNIGLCGFPLSKSCSNNNVPPPPNFPEENDDSESSITFGWKVVAIGYGCGLVFGLAVGYVVFQTGKPKWFVTLVEEQQHRRRKKPKIGDRSGVRRIYKSVQKLGPW